mmetsp:Transcript_809/g.2889  ORF Transcript_809/g.2889 Transcript_809/m.2889 type:complete len:302 (+) Transcript_809:135-1040(+)
MCPRQHGALRGATSAMHAWRGGSRCSDVVAVTFFVLGPRRRRRPAPPQRHGLLTAGTSLARGRGGADAVQSSGPRPPRRLLILPLRGDGLGVGVELARGVLCALPTSPAHRATAFARGSQLQAHGATAEKTIRGRSRTCDLGVATHLHALLAIEVVRAGERGSGAREGEHGEGHGDWHVDPHLPDIDVLLEFPRRGTGAREQRGAVAVRVGIDGGDCAVQAVGLHAYEHGPENLLLVAVHVRGDAREDGWPDEVALPVPRDLDTAAVQQQLCPLLHPTLDQLLDAPQRLGGNHRAEVRPRL